MYTRVPVNHRYKEIPIISRVYLTGSFLVSAACALQYIHPLNIYFNLKLIMAGQVWRLVSNFFFFGEFSLDFVFHMYFLVRYCRLLEEGSFRGRTADFLYMLILGAISLLLMAPFMGKAGYFLGSSLSFVMIYVWGRRNEHVRMNFLGLLPFTAPYLPWVLLAFSLVVGNSAMSDVMGIVVGHVYYFLEDVLPKVAEIRRWSWRRVLVTPSLLKRICNQIDVGDENIISNAQAEAVLGGGGLGGINNDAGVAQEANVGDNEHPHME
jgi:Derlin-2/3